MNQQKKEAAIRMVEKRAEQAYEQARQAGTIGEREEKLVALSKDETFKEKVSACGNDMEAIFALFAENGVELTEEEKQKVSRSKQKMDTSLEGELTDEELEQVAGGWGFAVWAVLVVIAIIIVCVCGDEEI